MQSKVRVIHFNKQSYRKVFIMIKEGGSYIEEAPTKHSSNGRETHYSEHANKHIYMLSFSEQLSVMFLIGPYHLIVV